MFPLRFAEQGLVSSVSGLADFATYLGAGIASAIYGIWIEGGMNGYLFMFLSWAILSIASIFILLLQHPFQKEEPEHV
jgi:predicted MFS family arabinose efflux permease